MQRGGTLRKSDVNENDPNLDKNYGSYWETTNFQVKQHTVPLWGHVDASAALSCPCEQCISALSVAPPRVDHHEST